MGIDMECQFECEYKNICIDACDCNYQCHNYQNCAACIHDGEYENCTKKEELLNMV